MSDHKRKTQFKLKINTYLITTDNLLSGRAESTDAITDLFDKVSTFTSLP